MSSPIVFYLSALGPILFEPAVAPGTPPAADHGAAASEAGLVNPPGSPAPTYSWWPNSPVVTTVVAVRGGFVYSVYDTWWLNHYSPIQPRFFSGELIGPVQHFDSPDSADVTPQVSTQSTNNATTPISQGSPVGVTTLVLTPESQ
ncbi:hypothetical protein B484DRAFT_427557 [Ochromonadaceae sp. CCMP2298]|nr:hypothetical protein B484DRAFT_427557 [Ochromonadaceae sp. CCMP2298]